MKPFMLLVFVIVSLQALAGETATTETGRKVILNDDGTWQEINDFKANDISNSQGKISQSVFGKSRSNADYKILNTYTTDTGISLCVEASNNTTDKLVEPVLGSIYCDDNGQYCSHVLKGSLIDGSKNNLSARANDTTITKFSGLPKFQLSLYPSETVYFEINARRPIKFDNMILSIDAVAISFDAIKEIRTTPKTDAKKMLEDPFAYTESFKKMLKDLVCEGRETIG